MHWRYTVKRNVRPVIKLAVLQKIKGRICFSQKSVWRPCWIMSTPCLLKSGKEYLARQLTVCLIFALLMTGITSKWKCVQAAYRYSNWDEESLKPVVHSPESLGYAMGKARFTYVNDKNDPDPMVQLMFDLSAPNASIQHQKQFLEALAFIDFQDISASQRVSQLSRHRRLRRTINNLKVTMKNGAQWSEFYDSTGITHLST